MRFSELGPEYLAYLSRQRNARPSTLRTYRSAFKTCREASAAIGVPDPDTETIDRRWANRLVQQLSVGRKPRTIHRDITAWRCMLAYACKQEYTTNNPLAGVELPKKGAVERVAVSDDDLNALLAATRRLFDRRRGVMARALLLIAATGATRYSDLMPLRLCDVLLGGHQ
jgi:site-specific recombinase XerC